MLSNDIPILKADNDILNRKTFAHNMAKVMMGYTESEAFTIGLYGPWGSGKTSVINMIFEAIESMSKDIIVFRFNPWLCSDSKQLITQFFKQMSETIKIKGKVSEKVWQLIGTYSDLLNIGDGTSILSIVAKFLGKKAKSIVNEGDGNLQKVKDNIIEYLKEEKIRIIVSIDDIDRLSEEEIVSVFQLVKSLGDFPNTIYLLAFDYDIVVKALENVQNGSGEDYLQKIVQVPFALPKANFDRIQQVLFDKLESIMPDLTKKDWDINAWVELYQQGIKIYIRTLRDVIRYTNTFSLKYELLKDETDAVDLLGLTCLEVFEPAMYDILPYYKNELCGNVNSYYSNNKSDEINKAFEVIMSVANDNTKDAAKRIVQLLFPGITSSWMGARAYNQGHFYIHKNIANPNIFNRYFSLALDSTEISSVFIENLLFKANETALRLAIQNISLKGKIVNLLEAFETYFRQAEELDLSSDRAKMLLICLIKQWETFNPPDDMSFFSTPFEWRLLLCMDFLLKRIITEEHFSLFENVFKNGQISIITISLILRELERQNGRFIDKTDDKEVIANLPIEQIEFLEHIFIERMNQEFEEGTLLKRDNEMYAINLLEDITPGLAAEKIANMVTDDQSLALLIHHCVGHGKGAVRVVFKTWHVEVKTVEKYINPEDAYKRMRLFIYQSDFTKLPLAYQEDIVVFIMTMEQKDTPKDKYPFHYREEEIHEKMKQLFE